MATIVIGLAGRQLLRDVRQRIGQANEIERCIAGGRCGLRARRYRHAHNGQ